MMTTNQQNTALYRNDSTPCFLAALCTCLLLMLGNASLWGSPTTYVWDCTTLTPTLGANADIPSVAFSAAQENNNGTTPLQTSASASSGYPGASGTTNFGAACQAGILSTATSTYFEVTLTPIGGHQIILNSASLGSRSTTTGPHLISIYSSIDGYGSALGSATVANNSTWTSNYVAFAGNSLTGAVSTTVTLRIYGSDGVGSPPANTANWRIDDIQLQVDALASGGASLAITTQPVSLTNLAGATATFIVTAIGDAPLAYQWYKAPANLLTDRTNSTLTIVPARATDAGNYYVIVTDVAGASVISSNATLTINCPAITVSPAALSVGAAGQAYTVNFTAASGTPPYGYAVSGGTLPDGLTLSAGGVLSGTPTGAGTFAFAVTAIDANGCAGSSNYMVMISAASGPTNVLTILTNGAGSLKAAAAGKRGTPTNGAPLVVGYDNYKITATPASTHLFSHWSVSGSGGTYTTNVSKLVFTMQNNLTITANFVTNRYFAATNGWYYGLFWETNSGVTFTNAGFLKLKVTARERKLPKFSGSLDMAGVRKGISGTFGLDGWGTSKPVDLNKWSRGMPTVRVKLPLSGSNDTFTGSVSNEAGLWVAEAEGYRAVPTSGYAGNYTLLVRGDATDSANVPGGDGYGLVSISSAGVLKLSGSKLADGQTLAQRLAVSLDGRLPLYSRGDRVAGGQYNSFILGWLTVNTNTGISGEVTWLKATNGPARYAGMGLETTVEGSAYWAVDPASTLILLWTNGVVTYEGAGIAAGAMSNRVTLAIVNGKNKFTTDKVNKMTLRLLPKNGKLTMTFDNPSDGNQKAKGEGAILLNQDGGSGYYLPAGNMKSGLIKLEKETP